MTEVCSPAQTLGLAPVFGSLGTKAHSELELYSKLYELLCVAGSAFIEIRTDGTAPDSQTSSEIGLGTADAFASRSTHKPSASQSCGD